MYLLARFLSLEVYLPSASLPTTEDTLPVGVRDEVHQETRNAVKVKAERCVQIERTLHHFNTDMGRMSNYATDADISIVLKLYENALAAIQQLKDKYASNLRTSDTQR
ncbi:hypothetical protein A0J61_10673 [Choanephora cucurbitarum]|uniref:Uncharacterized protein n=1 Tax=Choanephora cucurbitarum TaxID=101091 RepID=A0A1C7MY06_9FUNG|nr:hypothetical protein A0J61_10673 [Choanephora cucurbitarum]